MREQTNWLNYVKLWLVEKVIHLQMHLKSNKLKSMLVFLTFCCKMSQWNIDIFKVDPLNPNQNCWIIHKETSWYAQEMSCNKTKSQSQRQCIWKELAEKDKSDTKKSNIVLSLFQQIRFFKRNCIFFIFITYGNSFCWWTIAY